MKKFTQFSTLLIFAVLFSCNLFAQKQQFDGSTMRASNDNWLALGQSIFSKNGNYRASFQTDGNLCIFKIAGNGTCWRQLWETKTKGKFAKRVRFQSDGNLVIYDNQIKPIWSSGTDGHSNAVMVMQEDGNLVILEYNKPLWSSGTNNK